MVIPAFAIHAYLDGAVTVSVRNEDLSPGNVVTREEALMFAAANCVEGRGSRNKLKFLRLLCPFEEARERALAKARSLTGGAAPREARKIALDVIQRMAASRKFIFREQLFESGVRSGRWVFSHKPPVPGFGCAWMR